MRTDHRSECAASGVVLRLRAAAIAVLSIAAVSCNQDGPLHPSTPHDALPIDSVGEARPAQPHGPDGMFSPLLKDVDARTHELLSSDAELAAGRYRFRLGAGTPPTLSRDEFLSSTIDGRPFVRRVLSSELRDGVLTVETGPAYWHEVLQSGTYGFSVPIGRNAPATLRSGAVLPAMRSAGAGEASVVIDAGPMMATVPPISANLDGTNICGLIDGLLEKFNRDERLCDGQEHSLEAGAGLTVALTGVLDTLMIEKGDITVSGEMEIALTVDAGGLSGGAPPTFAPCNRAAYPGCFSTPTGAAFVEWLRDYAPQIPEASLPPLRVCIPGLPVRVKAGYWDKSGLIPVWRLAKYETCRVSSIGVLPTVILPSVLSNTSRIRPRIQGSVTTRFVGDGKLNLQVAIPKIGWSAVYSAGSKLKAKAEVGVFLFASVEAKNTGVSTTYTFDRIQEVQQAWNPDDGWSESHESLKSDGRIVIHDYSNPDSIVVKTGMVLSAGIEVCFAFTLCEVEEPDPADEESGEPDEQEARFKIVATAGADMPAFAEMTWDRVPVHPTDEDIDNWHTSTDMVEVLDMRAGIAIPLTGWILPDVPRSWEFSVETSRIRIKDTYGLGRLRVNTQTTGVNPDPDGYRVTLSRMDTLPVVLDPGTTRIGKAFDHGKPLQLDIASDGDATFGNLVAVPCGVWYTETLRLHPMVDLVADGLEAVGHGVPNYAMTGFCKLLIGRYEAVLTDVAENCTVVDGNVREDVWLLQTKHDAERHTNLTEIDFDVECVDLGAVGDLQITTLAVTSPDFEADYGILIDGVPHGLIGPSATQTFTRMNIGQRTISLVGGPTNCALPTPVTIDLPITGTNIGFVADCSLPAGALAIEATTSGVSANAHQVYVEGIPRASMPPQGLGIATGLPALTPTVVHVTPATTNCRPITPTPFIVSLNAAADPLTVPFELECTAGIITNVQGVIESSALATEPVRLRLDDGTIHVLAGPARAQLRQLGGVRVAVHGEMQGTSLSVYGFDIVPGPGEAVWTGIVAQRDGAWWLLGEDAVRLIDAPAGITNHPGAVMWLSGMRESGHDVSLGLYGLLRVAP